MSSYDTGKEPGTWGEFFASLEGMTTRMQSSKYSTYELVQALTTQLQADVVAKYNNAMATLIGHTTNTNDPHHVTRQSLGLGLVDNRDTASLQQIADGGYGDLFVTADGFSAIALKVFGNFADTLHHQGINPISVYGDLSWLPPEVSGSFEGAGMVSGNQASFSLLEDDGTLIGLRTGTNGTSRGLYYWNLPNAEDRIDSAPPNRMNLRYAPPARPAGFECLSTITSDPEVIVGGGYGNATYDGFVSLTNGTLDVSKHYTGYFNWTSIAANALDPMTSACVAGNYVYMFVPSVLQMTVPQGPEIHDPHEILVYRVPVSQITAGGAITWERVTVWNTTGLWGAMGSNTNIRLANAMTSANPANKPLVLHNNPVWFATLAPIWSGRRTHCTVNPASPNQIRLSIQHNVWTQIANGASVMPPVTYSVLLNLASKTATVEDGAAYLTQVSPDQNTVSIEGNIVTSVVRFFGWGNLVGNWHSNTLVTERGYLLTRGTGNQPDETNYYLQAQITNFVSRYESLRINKREVRLITGVRDNIKVGSDFSNGAMNPRLLPGLNVLFQGTQTRYTNLFSYGNCKRLTLTGAPTYDYKTINSGTIKGWAPNGTRIELVPEPKIGKSVFISRTASDGTIACDASIAYGPSADVSSGTAIDANRNITGNLTWSAAEGNNTALAVARNALGKSNIYQYSWMMYIPQDPGIPVLMVVSASTPRDDAVGFRSTIALAELNYSGARSGNIAGYTLKRVIDKAMYDKMPGGAYLQYETMAGLQSFKCADGTYLLSIGCPPVLQAYGGQTGAHWYAAVKPGTKTIEDATVKLYAHGYYPTAANPSGFVHPSYGLCMMDWATNVANFNSILAINVVAATYAEFVAWNVKQKLVLGAQEVEQGWLVYFTADTTAFLAGREYTLPSGNIDLRNVTANPANKTFYVYVRLVSTGIEYFITTETLAPTMTMMYIGKITTSTTQISTIEITKKIRVDTFELSPAHIGSAIPIGVGVPSQVGDFSGWTK